MLRKIAAKIAVLGEQIRQHRPLVHCITNPIAIHDSANIVLAAGGRPIMAEHPQEVEEIVRTAQGLVLNLGNITDVRMSSMKKAFQEALKNRVPTVLDLVGTTRDWKSDRTKRKYVRDAETGRAFHIWNRSGRRRKRPVFRGK